MNERIAVRAARWKSCSARGDRMLRSIPIIAPTKALTRTRSENCGRFARRPSRTPAPGSGAGRLLTGPLVRLAEVEAQHALHLRRLGGYVGQGVDEGLTGERQHRI